MTCSNFTPFFINQMEAIYSGINVILRTIFHNSIINSINSNNISTPTPLQLCSRITYDVESRHYPNCCLTIFHSSHKLNDNNERMFCQNIIMELIIVSNIGTCFFSF